MNREPPIIDHNEHEKRPTNAIWWVIWPIVALQWVGYLYFREFDWWSIALGAGTGLVLATWAIEITGNKVPDSWRSKPPRRR